ncbi:MAG: histidine phosphatase family protein [Ktedonobacterales bacterium]
MSLAALLFSGPEAAMGRDARTGERASEGREDALATTLFLVRHGENPANLTREFSHRVIDYSLTLRGVQQARQTARHFANQRIDALYTSPLKRAYETAAIIAGRLHLPVTVDERLREVNVGALETRPPSPETWALHDAIFARWLAGDEAACFPDGEDCVTLRGRMRASLGEMAARWPGGRVLVVAHGGIFAAALPALCANFPTSDDPATLHIPNCAITEVCLRGTCASLRGEIRGWAACGHLSE